MPTPRSPLEGPTSRLSRGGGAAPPAASDTRGSALVTPNISLTVTANTLPAPVYVGPLVFSNATENSAYTFSVASLFTGSVDSYTLVSGDLTGSGLSFNTATGEFSGTPPNDTDITGITVSATNTTGTSATSNTATLAINAQGTTIITSVTGTIADGQSVVVNGSGFGTMGGDVIQYGKGDESSAGIPITNVTPTVGNEYSTFIIGIGDDTAGEHMLMSASNNRTGRAGTFRRRRNNGSGANRNGGFGYSGRDDPELFFSYWRYFHADSSDYTTWNMKQYIVYSNGTTGTSSTEKPQPIVNIPPGGTWWDMSPNTDGADPAIYTTIPWTMADSSDVWQRWDTYLDLGDSEGRHGAFKVWRDNVDDMQSTDYNWMPSTPTVNPTGFKDFRLGFMDNNMINATTDFTDVYVATTRARVELGNASTFSACTHIEIQVGVSANWSTSAITVTLDKGSFSSFTGTYLYVIDSNGDVVDEDGFAL